MSMQAPGIGYAIKDVKLTPLRAPLCRMHQLKAATQCMHSAVMQLNADNAVSSTQLI